MYVVVSLIEEVKYRRKEKGNKVNESWSMDEKFANITKTIGGRTEGANMPVTSNGNGKAKDHALHAGFCNRENELNAFGIMRHSRK